MLHRRTRRRIQALAVAALPPAAVVLLSPNHAPPSVAHETTIPTVPECVFVTVSAANTTVSAFVCPNEVLGGG